VRLPGRLFGWAVFAATAAVLLTWVIGMPRFVSPDEPAHWYKAYATAHGQSVGVPVEGLPSNIRQYDVPAEMGIPNLGCFFFQPDVPAGCAIGAIEAGISSAAVYPPPWYGVVGGGARLVGQADSLRVNRAAGAVTCAALIGLAFAVARRAPSGRLTPLLLLAATPMTLFLAASVNPNGFEVAGFVLLWSLCLHIASDAAPSRRSGAIVGLVVAMLLLSRFASVIWVAFGAFVLVLLLGITGVRRFLTRDFLVPALGISGAASLLVVAWSRYAGVQTDDARLALDVGPREAARLSWERLPDFAEQMIGLLGWLDTEIPWYAHALYALFTLITVAGIVWSRDRRLIVAGIAVAAGLVVVPIAINVASAATAGLVWQGRYSLPLYAMLSLVGMIGWQRVFERRPDERLLTVVRSMAVACFAVAEVAAFWQAMRRFTVGASGKIWLDEPLPWSPSVAPMALIAINALLVATLAAVVLTGTASSSDQRATPQRVVAGPAE